MKRKIHIELKVRKHWHNNGLVKKENRGALNLHNIQNKQLNSTTIVTEAFFVRYSFAEINISVSSTSAPKTLTNKTPKQNISLICLVVSMQPYAHEHIWDPRTSAHVFYILCFDCFVSCHKRDILVMNSVLLVRTNQSYCY